MDRVLYINSQIVDIDQQTAIGITLQSFDFGQPAKPKLTVSNSVSIPATQKNLEIFGFAGVPGYMGTEAYTKHAAAYFVDGVEFMRGATTRVDEVAGGRIQIGLTQRPDLWDALRGVPWSQLISGYYYWLEGQGLIYTAGAPFVGFSGEDPEESMLSFLLDLANTQGARLGYSLRNLSADTTVNEGEGKLVLAWQNSDGTWRNGCHLNTPVLWLVNYLQTVTGWDLTAPVSDEVPSVWGDVVAQGLYLPVPEFVVRCNFDAKTWWIEIADSATVSSPFDDAKKDATAYDVLLGIMQLLNVVPEDKSTPTAKSMAFARFDSISETVDFSQNIEEVQSFTPYVAGLAQNNYIAFESVYDGGLARTGAKLVPSLNENLPFDKDALRIGARVPSVRLGSDGNYFLRMSEANDLSKLIYLSLSTTGKTVRVALYEWIDGVRVERVPLALLYLRVWQVYSPENEYLLYADMLQRPEVWKVRKWMTPNDLNNFSFLKRYSIPRLGGSFYVNKIEGFNPASKDPCTVELIKINNSVLLPFEEVGWLDNVEDPLNDNSGQLWI